MAGLTTVEILVQSTDPLDGSTLLDVDNPALQIDRGVVPATIRITVPPSVSPVGAFDFNHILLGTAAVQQGLPVLVARATAVSAGGAYPSTAVMTRRSPTVGGTTNAQLVQDLSLNGGQYLFRPKLLPALHTFGVDTDTVAGPHTLVFLVQPMTDADFLGAA